jgi:hypothetical protein
MHRTFAKDFSILAEDYEYFRREPSPSLEELQDQLDAATRQNKAIRRSEELSLKRSQE